MGQDKSHSRPCVDRFESRGVPWTGLSKWKGFVDTVPVQETRHLPPPRFHAGIGNLDLVGTLGIKVTCTGRRGGSTDPSFGHYSDSISCPTKVRGERKKGL